MGSFSAKLRVWNPNSPEKVEEIDALVDTGAAFSWIHRERLERMGITTLRRMGFRAIDGSIIERDTAAVWVASNGFTGPDTVVIAERNDMEVIGVHTIEGLGLAADPVQKKLVPTIGLALTAASSTKFTSTSS
jgi:predicted aspartyl protease